MKTGAHIFVSGLVQGVFFRAYTFQKAKELGLLGWVKNTNDGRVEVMVEGEKEKVEEMVRWLHQGSPLAKVEKVEVHWQDFSGQFNDFEIKYE